MPEAPHISDLPIALPPGNPLGGTRNQRLTVAVVRELDEGDLETLAASGAHSQTLAPRLTALRASHHRLAEALASSGDDRFASLVTGYSTTYITMLRGDPSFQELVAYYEGQKQVEFVDLLGQMKTLGSDIVAEIQERLGTNPEAFSLPELRAQLEVLVKGASSLGNAQTIARNGGAAPGTTLRVEFVTPSPQSSGPILDITPTVVEPRE